MGEYSIGDLIILKQRLQDCLDNNRLKEAEIIFYKIKEVCLSIGNIDIEKTMSEYEKNKLKKLFKGTIQ